MEVVPSHHLSIMWRGWGPLSPRTRALQHSSATGGDVARTALVALKESADGFPILKSVAGCVLAVWDTANRVSASKKRARALASRCRDILYVLHDAVPDPSNISPEMHASICTFVKLLEEIHSAMENTQNRSRIGRFCRLNRDKDEFEGFAQRLDEARQAFVMAATLRTEVKMSEMQYEVAGARATFSKLADKLPTKLELACIMSIPPATIGLF